MFANLTMGKRQRLDIPMISIKNLNSWKATPVKNVKAILNYLHGSTKYMSYTGHYEIKKNEIHHSVKMSSVVDLEGSVLVRQAKFDEDKLILTAFDDQGYKSTTELVWKKEW
jgi:hypothetical protein